MPFAEILHFTPRDIDRLTVAEFEHFVSELEKMRQRDEVEARRLHQQTGR